MSGKNKLRKNWRFWAFLCFLGLFLLSGSVLLRDHFQARREQAANQALAQQVHASEAAPAPEKPNAKEAQLRLLQAQNEDFAGWLSIDGTAVDYPVMYTPDDPDYYLHRAFDKSDAASGSLFIGEGCTPEGSHVIIYGHHMKDGAMFGSLPAYQDPDYAAAHPVICFDTPDGEGTYRVLAAFFSRVYKAGEENVFRYYQYADLSAPEQFRSYVEQARSASLYDTGVTAEYGDRLLTLSTCSYHTKNGRFVLVAVQAEN